MMGATWRKLLAGFRIQRTVARWSRKLRLDLPRLSTRLSGVPTLYPYDCNISRISGRYEASLSDDKIEFIVRYKRVPAALYWLSQCPPDVAAISVNLSDGNFPSAASFAYSANAPDILLLPDSEFFVNRGFEELKSFAITHDVDWSRRSGKLRWRGWTNGVGKTDYSAPGAAFDMAVLPRIRLALLLKGAPATDVALVGARDPKLVEGLRQDGLLMPKIPEQHWIGDKFALDIDGFTNAWSNFLVRLHLGCCVIKVESQGGYRQWYYDRIRPWEHFVPVRADMSDLVEKIDWARSHDSEARRIAENGRAFARSMTFESETQWAVNAICAASGISPI